MDFIKINNLCFEYKKNKPVLTDVNINIKKGSWTSIIGHNGSGKSTLSKLLIGLEMPKSGTIEVDKITLSEDTVHDIRRKIGIVFQNPDNQFVGTTVRDDIAFGLENRQYTSSRMQELVLEYTKKVNMSEFLKEEPHNLSGGQKQRVAIAGTLCLDSDVIIFDESMSMLDPQGRKEITEIIVELAKDLNKTIITITHNLNLAAKSDYIYVLKAGSVILEGIPQEVFEHSDTLDKIGLDIPYNLRVLNKATNLDPKVRDFIWELTFKK